MYPVSKYVFWIAFSLSESTKAWNQHTTRYQGRSFLHFTAEGKTTIK